MSLTLHTDKDTHIVNPGLYTHEYIRQIDSSNFDDKITKVSLQRNTIALISSGSSPTGYGDTHVLVGPTVYTVPDNFTVKSVRVDRYRDSNWGTGAKVTAYQDMHQQGSFKTLLLGEYDTERLSAREDGKIGISRVQSLGIGDGTLVVLYNDNKSLYLVGPRNIDDIVSYIENINRIVVYSTDKPPGDLKENPVGDQTPIRGASSRAYDDNWANASKQHNKRRIVFADGNFDMVQKYDKKDLPNNVYNVIKSHKKSDNLKLDELESESEFEHNYAKLFSIILLVIIAIYMGIFTTSQFIKSTAPEGFIKLGEDF
jgi:hypothetical protein